MLSVEDEDLDTSELTVMDFITESVTKLEGEVEPDSELNPVDE